MIHTDTRGSLDERNVVFLRYSTTVFLSILQPCAGILRYCTTVFLSILQPCAGNLRCSTNKSKVFLGMIWPAWWAFLRIFYASG